MKLIIKGKNLKTQGGGYGWNNSGEFNIAEGMNITENYNETLDSANVRIVHLSNKIDILPFDEVKLVDEDNRLADRYFCVDSFTCTEDTPYDIDNKTYSYSISLFSQTKMLENTRLPSLSVTPIKEETATQYGKSFSFTAPTLAEGASTTLDFNFNMHNNFLSYKDTLSFDFSLPSNLNSYFEFTTSEPVVSYFNINMNISFDLTVKRKIGSGTYIGLILFVCLVNLNHHKRKIYDYLDLYLNEYGEKIRTINSFTNKWHYKTGYTTKFNKDCPEMQWNNPTFREVLTSLMMVCDCIPVLNNGEIGWIDLTEKKTDISNYTGINYVQTSMSSSDFVSEARMDMQNVLQTNVEGTNNTVTHCDWVTVTSDDYVLKDNNYVLKTTYPILNVKHLWMGFGVTTSGLIDGFRDFVFKTVDLCNYLENDSNKTVSFLKESKEYQTLENYYKIKKDNSSPTYIGIKKKKSDNDFQTVKTFEELTSYKGMCIYYTRGGNTISGLSKLNKASYLVSDFTTAELIQYAVFKRIYEELGSTAMFNFDAIANMVFKIEYETQADQVFSAGKDIYPQNKRVITDNQTNSWVDAYNQGNLEYQKVNRLGNEQVMINQRVSNGDASNNLIKIGDYRNDEIIFRTQYQIYKDHIETNSNATKNYVLRDYYTGIQSKIRTWVNAQDEAFIRHELNKTYCEFSYNAHMENMTDSFQFVNNLAKPFEMTTLFTTYEAKPLRYAVFNVDGKDLNINSMDLDDYDSYQHLRNSLTLYLLDCVTRIIGNSIVTTCGFRDNYNADTSFQENEFSAETFYGGSSGGAAVVMEDYSSRSTDHTTMDIDLSGDEDYGGMPLQNNKYVGFNGEIRNYNLIYLNNFEVDWNVEGSTTFPFTFRDGGITANVLRLNEGGTTGNITSMGSVVAGMIRNTCLLPFIKNVYYFQHRDGNGYTGDYRLFNKTFTDYLKDNKEILKFSNQIEFCRDTREITFSKRFIELQEIVRDVNFLGKLLVAKYEGGEQEIITFNKNIVAGSTTSLKLNFVVSNNFAINCVNKKVSILLGDDELITFIAKSSNIINNTLFVYMNLLIDRDHNTYDNDGIRNGTI